MARPPRSRRSHGQGGGSARVGRTSPSCCPVRLCQARPMDVPDNLRWMHDNPDTRAWLATVPDRLQRAAERWELDLGPVFAGAHLSYTCPATTADGTDVVLKLQYPHEDCRCE